MRVCIVHKEKAVLTLKNIRDDSEYDLCETCKAEFEKIISEEVKRGRKRTA